MPNFDVRTSVLFLVNIRVNFDRERATSTANDGRRDSTRSCFASK